MSYKSIHIFNLGHTQVQDSSIIHYFCMLREPDPQSYGRGRTFVYRSRLRNFRLKFPSVFGRRPFAMGKGRNPNLGLYSGGIVYGRNIFHFFERLKSISSYSGEYLVKRTTNAQKRCSNLYRPYSIKCMVLNHRVYY